ncbi:MAG: Flagellar biosynthesis protein FliO [Verrucomicrobiota bacterium]|jgi:flagellar biogenesis protein FliO
MPRLHPQGSLAAVATVIALAALMLAAGGTAALGADPGSAAAAAAATTAAAPSAAPASGLPDLGLSLVRVLGALALVLALCLGGAWLFRNWQRLAIHRGRTPHLQILEVKSLGGRHALYLVACDQQRFLVGSSPGGLNLLTHLPEGEAMDPATPPAAPKFTEALRQALAGKA